MINEYKQIKHCYHIDMPVLSDKKISAKEHDKQIKLKICGTLKSVIFIKSGSLSMKATDKHINKLSYRKRFI